MLVRVDPASSVPLYGQVAAQVRGTILRGEIGAGERLPPARELADALDLNMHTVLRAYAELRDEGLVELRRGRGVTVVAAPAKTRVRHLVSDLVVEARRLGLTNREVQALVREQL